MPERRHVTPRCCLRLIISAIIARFDAIAIAIAYAITTLRFRRYCRWRRAISIVAQPFRRCISTFSAFAREKSLPDTPFRLFDAMPLMPPLDYA